MDLKLFCLDQIIVREDTLTHCCWLRKPFFLGSGDGAAEQRHTFPVMVGQNGAHPPTAAHLCITLLPCFWESVSLCLLQWEKTLGSAGHEHLEKAFWFGSLLFYPTASNFCIFFATATEVCSWHCRGTGMQSSLLQNSM